MKHKQVTILSFNFRDDYNQVLYLKDQNSQGKTVIQQAVIQNMRDLKESSKDEFGSKQKQINNIILRINKKITRAVPFALRITTMTENLQMIYWDRIIRAIMKNKFGNKQEEICLDLHDKLVPIKMQRTA